MEYVVCGLIVIRVGEIEEELKKVYGYKYFLCNLMLNFKIYIFCNCTVYLILIWFSLYYVCWMSLLFYYIF